MYALHLNPVRHFKVYMGEIPYCLDRSFRQHLRDLNGRSFRNRKHRDINIILSDKSRHLFHGKDRHIRDFRAVQRGIDIKCSLERKSPVLEIHVIDQGLSQIAGADQNHIMLLVQPQYLADLFVQIAGIVSVSLLPETAEIIEILPDLRGSDVHDPAQLLRRNPLDTFVLKVA